MQSLSFIQHLEEIYDRLNIDKFLEFTPKIISQKPENFNEEFRAKFSEITFSSVAGYSDLIKDENRARILESLGLNNTFNSRSLSEMLSIINTKDNSQNVWGDPKALILFTSFFSSLAIVRSYFQTLDAFIRKERLVSVTDNERVLEMEVIDFSNTGIELIRLQSILESIQKLHDTIALILGDKEARISIVSLDSGSDVLLFLKGSIEIIGSMQSLFIQLWEKIRFRHYEGFERKMISVEKGVDLLERIAENENKGILEVEESKRLKHSIITEMSNLINRGALSKEILDVKDQIDRRKLLTEQRGIKLLEKPKPDLTDGGN